MKSVNYVAGLAGWQVTRDGDAEFNSAVIRGDLEIGPASPNPRLALTQNIPAALVAASADFDWKAGVFLWYNGTDFEFEVIGTYIPGPNSPIWGKGTYDTFNGVIYNWLETGPGSGGGQPRIFFGSDAYNSSSIAVAVRNTEWEFTSTSTVINPAGVMYSNGMLERGARTSGFTVTAGAAPTAEVAIPAASWDKEATITCRPGHVYRFKWSGQLAVSGVIGFAGGTIRIRVGSATIVGTEVARTYVAASTNAWEPTSDGEGLAAYTGGVAASRTFSLTIQRNTGAAGTNLLIDSDSASPVVLEVIDEGLYVEGRFSTVLTTFT
jgi:hypothetical protein